MSVETFLLLVAAVNIIGYFLTRNRDTVKVLLILALVIIGVPIVLALLAAARLTAAGINPW